MNHPSIKPSLLRLLIISIFSLALGACSAEKTAQQVHQAFWAAVISNDASSVVEYSTLSNTESYNAFSKNWQNQQLHTGKVIIDNNKARIETTLSVIDSQPQQSLQFITYLVKQNENWLVDYPRTEKAMQPNAVSQLFGKLEQFSEKLSEQLDDSSEEIGTELDQMGEQLKDYSEEITEQASESIEKFGNQIKDSIEELERSTDKLLEDDKQEENAVEEKPGGLIKI